MNRELLGSLGLLGVVLVAGCGSDDDEENPGALAAYASARCGAIQRCDSEQFAYYGGSSCAERFLLYLEASTLPGMNLDANFLASCSAATKAASCAEFKWGIVKGCELPAGTLPDGAACMQAEQCESQFCARDSYAHCGSCAARAQLGEPCDNGILCAKELWCALDSSGLHVCAELPDGSVPETPSPPKVGDSCDSYGKSCGAEFRCHNGLCALRVQLGGDCAVTDDCVAGAWCDYEGGRVCQAKKTVGVGEACDAGGVVCADGLYCKGDAVCVAYIADGQPCESYGGYTPGGCLFPATCEEGVCTLPTAPVCE